MIKVPFEFNVWYRHRGNNKYIPARVDNALKAGNDIFVRYRNGHIVRGTGFVNLLDVWMHFKDNWDIMAYKIMEKK